MIAELYQVIEMMAEDKSNEWPDEIAVIERAIRTIERQSREIKYLMED